MRYAVAEGGAHHAVTAVVAAPPTERGADMAQGETTERLWLRDERGDLYVLTPDLLDAIRVPAEHRAQAETIVGGGAADAGFIGIHALASQGRATSAPLSFTV